MYQSKRRDFLQKCLYLGSSALLPTAFISQSPLLLAFSKDEQAKAKKAKYHFSFNSPYLTSDFETTPHAHMEIKQIIEEMTQNKVYVQINEGGVNGIGNRLINGVRYGKHQGALLSAANLTPKIKELDILNIPFWSAKPEQYIRLTQSDVWHRHVSMKASKYNLRILIHYLVGARTATTIKSYNKTIVAPEDFKGVRFRVSSSKNLETLYALAKAKPKHIPWGLCAENARKGRFQALDPSIVGLYSGPGGLKNEIATISQIESVHDGWIAIANEDFIQSLDSVTQSQFLHAFEIIQDKQFSLYQRANGLCKESFRNLGVKIYTPTQSEKQELADRFGHHIPAWTPIKQQLLGKDGMAIFDALFKAAQG